MKKDINATDELEKEIVQKVLRVEILKDQERGYGGEKTEYNCHAYADMQ